MPERTRTTRRQILKNSAGLAAGAFAAPYMLTSQAPGAKQKPSAGQKLTLGLIGVGWIGGHHLKTIVNNKAFKILGISDVDQKHLDWAVNLAGDDCKGYHDYRDLLARDDIDAMIIATPDHWHARMTIDACRAGKDVYCEKPLSLTIQEAKEMVHAVRSNGIVFQTGSMQRSWDCFRQACEWVRSGRIGKLKWVKACIGGGPTCGWATPQPVPDHLDWDRWLGPAPWAEYHPDRCHKQFRWLYDYSGGIMTDWGAHHNDIAQWGMGTDHTGPIKTEPLEYTFPTHGLWDTITSFKIKHTYANGIPLYTVSHADFRGTHFEGTEGWVQVNRSGYKVSDPDIAKEPLGPNDVHLTRSPGFAFHGHYMNWLECIKTRKRPICDVEIGANTAIISHLGNIAARTGKTVEWDPQQQVITNDPSLNRWTDKPYRSPWRL
jgi:predicted dehydrogenase